MKNRGIQLGSDYDLDIKVRRDSAGVILSGLQIGEVTPQNQALILTAQKGEYKENPLVGVGLNDAVNDNEIWLWKREITDQIENDGQRITVLELSASGMKLEAKYK